MTPLQKDRLTLAAIAAMTIACLVWGAVVIGGAALEAASHCCP